MTIGVIGRKAGMTRIFTDEGASEPVTVIQVEPNIKHCRIVFVHKYFGVCIVELITELVFESIVIIRNQRKSYPQVDSISE